MAESKTPGESDWEDEDLLTQDEAVARLRNEIAQEEAVLVEAGKDESPATVRRSQRLAAMRRRLERIDTTSATDVGVVQEIEGRARER